jgi:hypothetical protein
MNALNLNLADPAVRELLGEDHQRVLEERHRKQHGDGGRELVHLAGDMDSGLSHTVDLASGKREVTVTYKDFVLTVDVYQIPDEPTCVVLICPRCRHALRISADRKQIDFDPKAGDPKLGGRLSIEPFQCTWELTADKHVPGIVGGGISLCKWTAGIEKNVARDA